MKHGVLLLLVACQSSGSDTGVPAECGPEGKSEAWCPIDACAEECSSVESGVECCINAHGYGLDGLALENLSITCSGSDCDPEQYLSEESALCIAQAYGLESGIDWCGGGFVYQETPLWIVTNTTSKECLEDGHGELVGDAISLHARTGAFKGGLTVYRLVEECPEE